MILNIESQLDVLAKAGQLAAADHQRLRSPLNRGLRAMRRGNPAEALARLKRFEQRATALVQKVRLDAKNRRGDRQPVAGCRTVRQRSLHAVCGAPEFSAVRRRGAVHVRDASRGASFAFQTCNEAARQPRGPFATIADALARVSTLKACGVEIVLAPGSYPETVVLDRALRIRGMSLHPSMYPISALVSCMRNDVEFRMGPDQPQMQTPFLPPACEPELRTCLVLEPCISVPFDCDWCAR